MAYIVSVRARYCQILRFKARLNDGPGYGRRSSILDERLCPLGASLVPCRLRAISVKEPLNPNYISISLWGFFAIQRSAAFSVPHRSGSPGAPGEWTRWLGRANAVSWHPRRDATATDQGQNQCSLRIFSSA
jgi:hypothetical protein